MKKTRQEIEKQIHSLKNNLRKVNYQKKQIEFKIKALEKGLSHITLEEIPVNKNTYEYLKFKEFKNCKEVYDYYNTDLNLVEALREVSDFIIKHENLDSSKDDIKVASEYVHNKATAILASLDNLSSSIRNLLIEERSEGPWERLSY